MSAELLERFERAAMAYERLGKMSRDDEKTRAMRKDTIAELVAARTALTAELEAVKRERDLFAEERDAARFAHRNGKSLAEDSIHAIRQLLNEAGVPLAAFIDDHVGNAVVQRNQERAARETAERERDERAGWASEWFRVVQTIATILGLPEPEGHTVAGLVRDKFDAIARERDEAREALKPFGSLSYDEYADVADDTVVQLIIQHDGENPDADERLGQVNFSDLRRAREAGGGDG